MGHMRRSSGDSSNVLFFDLGGAFVFFSNYSYFVIIHHTLCFMHLFSVCYLSQLIKV